ncbi:hypothetical protein PGIGA_G00119160 [Pangasianodon gigas]|uniref:Uncharacterized protein n=1 Tax=Pangasianodon gigas TaxID=30993 RepID=A0ACC5XFY4_PANGG|nr:hypothetical protein [Pangasianodon gigas]
MHRQVSPPKGWLGLRLRLGEKPIQEEKSGILCQHHNCPERYLAAKVRLQNVPYGHTSPYKGKHRLA